MTIDDPLWDEFQPLWLALSKRPNQVILAGGYGLFLKQKWLLANPNTPTIVGIQDWPDATPRVTNDLDLVLGLELLASRESQAAIAGTMNQRGFAVVQGNERWRFMKQVNRDRTFYVDLHAEPPESEHPNLDQDRIRVKHKPSLGKQGVHGRRNDEAAGCDVHPFLFQMDGVDIAVPNPVTWAVMKIVAAQDRWRKAEEAGDQKDRDWQRSQAIKHARDVARIVAMTTLGERDRAAEVADSIRETEGFVGAAASYAGIFDQANKLWGWQAIAGQWSEDDLRAILGILKTWLE